VLVIGDDVGWSDFGFMGATGIRTPNLDRLAAEGVVFTHAMSSGSACKPALRTLLTGLEPPEVRTRLLTAGRGRTALPPFREVFETLPERLADEGYASFQAGKFWEGSFDMGGFTHGMTTRYGNDVEDFVGYHKHSGADGLRIGRETMEPLFSFLEEVRGRPFFVWYAPLLPHLPHDAPEEFTALYAKAPIPEHVRAYRSTLTWFDATVGALLAKLDELEVRDDTLVIYLSDNGWDSSVVDSTRG
jgi:arylsulfatase A-like enzyme